MRTPSRDTVVALFALLVAAWLIASAWPQFKNSLMTFPADASIDWAGARVLVEGKNPYDDENLRRFGMNEEKGLGHPPTALLWFLPFGNSDVDEMKLAWTILTLGWLFLLLMIAVTELQFPWPRVTTLCLFGAVLHTSWMDDHFQMAQLSTLIALLYTLAWQFRRRGRDTLAGISLGLACTLKLFPGVVILLLLLEKRVRLAIAAFVTWLALAAAVTLRIGHLHCWQQFLSQTEWYTRYWMAHIRNGAIQGIVQRLHYPVCQYGEGLHAVWRTGSIIASLVSLTLIAGAFFLCRRARIDRLPAAADLSFGTYAVLSLVTNPYVWEHYNVILLLPFLIALRVAFEAVREPMSRRDRARGIAGCVGLGVAAVILSLNVHSKVALWQKVASSFPPTPAEHARLHLLEILNWLAPMLILSVLALQLWLRPRKNPAS